MAFLFFFKLKNFMYKSNNFLRNKVDTYEQHLY
jgi:hypothetical protein